MPRTRDRARGGTALALTALALAACVTPSRRELETQQAEVRQMASAHAVHMPPAGTDSCVGVTLRLADPAAGAETTAERDAIAARISGAEVDAALASAGLDVCRALWLDAVAAGRITAEPMLLRVDVGIDPAGKVCAVVERTRMTPVDPAATGVLEQAAGCLKDVLFRAPLPAGRVVDRERVVRTIELSAAPGG
ncbi:hypothetical protein L6R52_06560 [Myxococcota bacterium]|nr:hypothetical protein [Myxococcota bacterium]